MSAPQQPPPSPAAASSPPVSSEPDRLEKIAKFAGWFRGALVAAGALVAGLLVAGWRARADYDTFARKTEVESAVRGVADKQEELAKKADDAQAATSARLSAVEVRAAVLETNLGWIVQSVDSIARTVGAPVPAPPPAITVTRTGGTVP